MPMYTSPKKKKQPDTFPAPIPTPSKKLVFNFNPLHFPGAMRSLGMSFWEVYPAHFQAWLGVFVHYVRIYV